MGPQGIDLGIDGLRDFKEIGSGGFATVYSAQDEGFGRLVAVKVLHRLSDEVGRRRFDRERELMGSLDDHPNVVTPYRFGYTSAGWPYLVMELVSGGSLSDLLDERGSIPWDDAVAFIAPIADALGRAHSRGVLHRDVKPANILLTANGVPKLTDFGIAGVREVTASQQAFSVAQSPPEAFVRGLDHRDERSDLYSLAATLFNLVTGRPPFAIEGVDSDPSHILRIEQEPTPRTGDPIQDGFFSVALAKKRNERHSTAEEFAQALLATVKGVEPIATAAGFVHSTPERTTNPDPPPIAWERPPKRRFLTPSRGRGTLAVGFLAVLAVLGFAGLGARQLFASEPEPDRLASSPLELAETDNSVLSAGIDETAVGFTAESETRPNRELNDDGDLVEPANISGPNDRGTTTASTAGAIDLKTTRTAAPTTTSRGSTTSSTVNTTRPTSASTTARPTTTRPTTSTTARPTTTTPTTAPTTQRTTTTRPTTTTATGPSQARVLLNEGIAFQESGQHDNAIDAFTGSIAADAAIAETYLYRSLSYRVKARFTDAVNDTTVAIGLDPSSVDAFLNRGIALRSLRRYEEAQPDFNQALTLRPTSLPALFNRGLNHDLMGQLSLAMADYDESIRIAPNHVASHWHRASARGRSGLLPGARSDLEKFITITTPSDSRIATAQTMIAEIDAGRNPFS